MSENTMTPEQSGSGELTVGQAAQAFEGLMDTPANSKEQSEGELQAQEAEAPEAESQQEVEQTEEVVDEPVDEQEDDSQEEEQPQRIRVKAAGEEKEVTLDELIKGYQLGADYTKKTTEVAEQRKAVEAERKAIEEAKYVRDNYAQRLQAVEQLLTSQQTPQEDLQLLKENDPIGYAVKVAEMAEKKEQLAAIRAEQNRIAQEQQSEYAKAMQAKVQEEAAKLAQALPEFSDPNKGENLRKEIRAYGKAAGFTDEELASVYDSRHVLTLHKAMLYDKLQKSKPTINKKVSEAPKLMRAGTSGSSKTSEAQAIQKQKAKLLNSGKVRDAASLFEQFLE